MSTVNEDGITAPVEPKSRLRFLIPLALFIVLASFLLRGLFLNPREVPSPLINKPAPAFALPRLDDPSQTIALKDLAGKLTDAQMRKLNYAVDGDRRDVKEVVREFLSGE